MIEEHNGWIVSDTKCRICGHEMVAVYPASTPEPENLQCGKCGNMTAEPVEDEEEE